jgi:hypothetical protein
METSPMRSWVCSDGAQQWTQQTPMSKHLHVCLWLTTATRFSND